MVKLVEWQEEEGSVCVLVDRQCDGLHGSRRDRPTGMDREIDRWLDGGEGKR